MKTTTLHATLFTLLASVGLAGCGENATETTATQPTPATTAPAQAGTKYTVITTGTADPFSMKDEHGGMSGLDVDIIKAVGEVEGFSVEFFELPWQQVLPAIEDKEYDIAINGINYSDDRNSKYGLTNPYFYNPSAFMYKKDASVRPTTLAELEGIMVAVMESSKQDIEATAINGAKVVRTPNLYTAYKKMVSGEAQVVAYDLAVMQSLTKKHNNTGVVFVPYEDKANKNTYNVFVVHKENQALLNKINSGLDKLQKSGKLDEIRKKHLGE